MLKMDNDDKYFKEFYPNFFTVYKPEQAVSDLFKKESGTILKKLAKQYRFTPYDTIDADTIDGGIISKSTKMVFPPPRDSCGLISLKLGNDGGGGGHWAAWVYLQGNKHLHLYDSMMNSGSSNFVDTFKKILRNTFPGATVSQAPCTSCSRLKGVRIKSETRQPTGGFVYGESEIILDAIRIKDFLSATNYERITGYKSQHQYCFAEAMMFLEDVMSGNVKRRCSTPRVALEQIKKYIVEKLKPLYPKRNFDDFLKIYNPATKRINSI